MQFEQQVVNKLGVKGAEGAGFPVYQILSLRLYRAIRLDLKSPLGVTEAVLWDSLRSIDLKCVNGSSR